jgi:hypothetical protein
MIVLKPDKKEIHLCLSRAICHLIVFTIGKRRRKRKSLLEKEDEDQ